MMNLIPFEDSDRHGLAQKGTFVQFMGVLRDRVPEPLSSNGVELVAFPYMEALACGLITVIRMVGAKINVVPATAHIALHQIGPIAQRWLDAGLKFKYQTPEQAAQVFLTKMRQAAEAESAEFLTGVFTRAAEGFFQDALRSIEPERLRLQGLVEKLRGASVSGPLNRRIRVLGSQCWGGVPRERFVTRWRFAHLSDRGGGIFSRARNQGYLRGSTY